MKNDTKFVQIGLRRKGRIVKNEQYNLREFPNVILVDRCCPSLKLDPQNLFSKIVMKLIGSKYISKRLIESFQQGYRECMGDLVTDMSDAIDYDNFGKKKK